MVPREFLVFAMLLWELCWGLGVCGILNQYYFYLDTYQQNQRPQLYDPKQSTPFKLPANFQPSRTQTKIKTVELSTDHWFLWCFFPPCLWITVKFHWQRIQVVLRRTSSIRPLSLPRSDQSALSLGSWLSSSSFLDSTLDIRQKMHWDWTMVSASRSPCDRRPGRLLLVWSTDTALAFVVVSFILAVGYSSVAATCRL